MMCSVESMRGEDFLGIRETLGASVVDETKMSVVALGDSLEILRSLPDKSVSLILCDPPYHSTHKANIFGDKAFNNDQRFLAWIKLYAEEWKRILRLSGTLHMFCSSRMSSRLEVVMSEVFLPVSNITWTKPNDPGYDGWKGEDEEGVSAPVVPTCGKNSRLRARCLRGSHGDSTDTSERLFAPT